MDISLDLATCTPAGRKLTLRIPHSSFRGLQSGRDAEAVGLDVILCRKTQDFMDGIVRIEYYWH